MFVRYGFALLALVATANALFCDSSANCKTCTSNLLCYFNIGDNQCKSILGQALTNQANVISIPYDCPVTPPATFPYDDTFARTQAYVFSAASNGDGEAEIQKCLDHVNAQFEYQITIPCDALNQNCSAYIAVNPTEKAIVLTFRGSKGSIQFYTEALNLLLFASRPSKYVDGLVFTYFADAFDKLWENGIQAKLQELHTANPDYELWTFGHSLGGSLASMASVTVVKSGMFDSTKVKSITMGQPRTGDLTYVVSHDTYIPNSYRIVHATDLVTKLPLKVLPGQINAYHHRFEVWYNNDMSGANYVVIERGDTGSASNGGVNLVDSSHLTYFNQDIDNYYLTNC